MSCKCFLNYRMLKSNYSNALITYLESGNRLHVSCGLFPIMSHSKKSELWFALPQRQRNGIQEGLSPFPKVLKSEFRHRSCQSPLTMAASLSVHFWHNSLKFSEMHFKWWAEEMGREMLPMHGGNHKAKWRPSTAHQSLCCCLRSPVKSTVT